MLLHVEYRLLAEGLLLNGMGIGAAVAVAVAVVARVMSNEGRGRSQNTISANESMLAERCKALLSLRL